MALTFLIPAVVAVAFLAIGALQMKSAGRLARMVAQAPSMAVPGEDRCVVGVARAVDPPRPAPVSGTPALCAVGYETVETSQVDRDGNRQTRRHTSEVGRVMTRFAVVDEQDARSGVLVDGAMLDSFEVSRSRVAGGSPVESRVGRERPRLSLEVGGIRLSQEQSAGHRWSSESVVRDGDRVWVSGSLTQGGAHLEFDAGACLADRDPSSRAKSERKTAVMFFVGTAVSLAVLVVMLA